MSKSNRHDHRRNRRHHEPEFLEDFLADYPDLVPVDEEIANTDQSRLVLEAVLRSHRWQLVSVARHHLGNRRQDAEEIVQELCLDVLAEHILVPPDPTEALDVLVREVIERCDGGAR